MKATFDLPEELIREMKLRAVMQGRTLRDLAAEFIRVGLGMAAPRPRQASPQGSMVQIGPGGLPFILCRSDARSSRVSVLDLLAVEQEAQFSEDSESAGLPV